MTPIKVCAWPVEQLRENRNRTELEMFLFMYLFGLLWCGPSVSTFLWLKPSVSLGMVKKTNSFLIVARIAAGKSGSFTSEGSA